VLPGDELLQRGCGEHPPGKTANDGAPNGFF